jgi:hypothetical protein
MAKSEDVFKEDFFERVVNVRWGGEAVEFKAGTALLAENLSQQNSGNFTISMWVQFDMYAVTVGGEGGSLNSAASIFKILGPQPEGVGAELGEGGVLIRFFGSVGFTPNLEVQFAGPTLVNYVGDVRKEYSTSISGGGPAPSYRDKDWNHLFVSIAWNWSGENVGNLWPFNVILNGVPVYIPDPETSIGFIHGEPRGISGGSAETTPGILFKDNNLFLPENPFGNTTVRVTGSRTIAFCDVQVWLGKYINPTTNLNKFFVKSGDELKRVDTEVAKKAFGKPTFLMKGGAKTFVKNQGAAKEPLITTAVSGEGEIRTFSPAPVKAAS